MTKFLRRRRKRSKDLTPTLVNIAQGEQDGWAVLTAHEVDTLIDSRAYFVRGLDIYVTAKITWGEAQPIPYSPERLLFTRV